MAAAGFFAPPRAATAPRGHRAVPWVEK